MAKATPCEIRLSPPVTSLCGDSSSHNKLSASVKHGTTYFRRISCAEQAAVGVRLNCFQQLLHKLRGPLQYLCLFEVS